MNNCLGCGTILQDSNPKQTGYTSNILNKYNTIISSIEIKNKNKDSLLNEQDSIKNEVNSELSQYQLDSINGRTPDVEDNPIASNEITNNDLSRHLDLIKERFSLFNEVVKKKRKHHNP